MSSYAEYICKGAHCKCMDKDCPNYHNGDHTCPSSVKASNSDTELRAAIDNFLGSTHYDDPKRHDKLEALIKKAISAERTAIKALLPDERVGTDKIPLDSAERGYNIAIQDVTQVIDGREGV